MRPRQTTRPRGILRPLLEGETVAYSCSRSTFPTVEGPRRWVPTASSRYFTALEKSEIGLFPIHSHGPFAIQVPENKKTDLSLRTEKNRNRKTDSSLRTEKNRNRKTDSSLITENRKTDSSLITGGNDRGSEAGSYLRLIDFCITQLVIKKVKRPRQATLDCSSAKKLSEKGPPSPFARAAASFPISRGLCGVCGVCVVCVVCVWCVCGVCGVCGVCVWCGVCVVCVWCVWGVVCGCVCVVCKWCVCVVSLLQELPRAFRFRGACHQPSQIPLYYSQPFLRGLSW